jgi:hypothetical protein
MSGDIECTAEGTRAFRELLQDIGSLREQRQLTFACTLRTGRIRDVYRKSDGERVPATDDIYCFSALYTSFGSKSPTD